MILKIVSQRNAETEYVVQLDRINVYCAADTVQCTLPSDQGQQIKHFDSFVLLPIRRCVMLSNFRSNFVTPHQTTQ